MPLYMDTHRKVKGVTAAAVAEAHAKDLKVQGKHGVNYRNYWVDEKTETIFCLVEAPSPEAAARVHKEAHGLVADEIHEVHQGRVGSLAGPSPGSGKAPFSGRSD